MNRIIKNCPHCGDIGREMKNEKTGYYYVVCRRCGCKTGLHYEQSTALKFWNRRV